MTHTARIESAIPPAAESPARRLAVSPQLLVALALALVYHGSMLLAGTYQRTYDAWIHVFFADHYARSWFDPWEPRWYTGFPMTSYPPGSQQAIALLSGLFGLQSAFVIVQTCAVLWMIVGVYRSSRIWVSEEAAGAAALVAVFASSITETIHVFGQLPTSFSMGFLLNALPYAYRWIRRGEPRILLVAWATNAATTAGHHVTTLFGAVFFVAPVIVLAIAESFREALADEPPGSPSRVTRATMRPLMMRRLRRMLPSLVRAGVYGVGLGAALVLVVLPYWLYSKDDPITQVSIPHASRDSFLVNPNAGLVFWLIPYGLSVLLFPYVYAKGFTTRAWPLASSIALLMLLGTGGTTPIPKMILRGSFDILTLDRFTFWATIAMLPLLGAFAVSLRHGTVAGLIREQLGRTMLRTIQIGMVVAYLLVAAFVANLTQYRKFQPPAIDMQPIATFLAKDQHDRWRYLTLGFGDQMAWLSAQTTATSVDGNYHSARRLPEMTTTSVERLEGAKFRGLPGIGSLQQFLAVPEKYNLKFILSNDQFYDPLLFFSGWHRLQRLENGIVVWEREDIPPLPDVLPRREIPGWQRAMWGIVPMGAIFVDIIAIAAVTLWRPQSPARPRRQGRLMRWADARLRAASALPERDDSPPAPWQPWLDWGRRIRAAAPPPAPRARRAARSALLGVNVLALAGLLGLFYWQTQLSPRALLEHYYDDLDFRRFADAYARLDPQARPSYEEYLLQLSVQGGLVASYGKLDSVFVSVTQDSPAHARADVRASFITALSTYSASYRHELVQRDGRWYIVPDAQDPTTPPDAYFRRPVVAWHAAGRRRTGTGPTDFGDILDRPELRLLSARLVRADGRYRVVGEVIDVDSDPGDVTVGALLYGADGKELTRYNAQTAIVHKIYPKEITPFRVDFEGVAGAVLSDTVKAADFRPGAFTPPDLLEPVASFDVQPHAVITSRDLSRALTAQDIQVVRGADGIWRVNGTLYNTGPDEATIPHVLLTLYDADGQVAWVEELFVESAVRPQRSTPFSVAVRPPSQVETIMRGPAAERQPDAAVIPLPPESGYSAMRLTVHAYVAGGG